MVERPKGMHTNGGCRCFAPPSAWHQAPPEHMRRLHKAFKRVTDTREAIVENLCAWLVGGPNRNDTVQMPDARFYMFKTPDEMVEAIRGEFLGSREVPTSEVVRQNVAELEKLVGGRHVAPTRAFTVGATKSYDRSLAGTQVVRKLGKDPVEDYPGGYAFKTVEDAMVLVAKVEADCGVPCSVYKLRLPGTWDECTDIGEDGVAYLLVDAVVLGKVEGP